MKSWLTLILLGVAVMGCDRFQPARVPTPTLTPTAVPSSVPSPTEIPSLTPLPSTPTFAPTDTPLPTSVGGATATEVPTGTSTPAATKTRAPITARPRATSTSTPVNLKYNAPVLIEPGAGDTRLVGKDDFLFRWNSVANLGPKECYLLTVQVVNLADPLQHYGEDAFVGQDTCNSAISSGIVEFTLRKRNPPSYAGLVAIASQAMPSNQFKVRWWVTVVLDNGPDPQHPGKELTTPLSPPSEQFEFTLYSP